MTTRRLIDQMLTDTPTLRDDLVSLRALRVEDADMVVQLSLDPVTQRWTSIAPAFNVTDALHWITQIIPDGWAAGRDSTFAVEHDGALVGTVGLRIEGDGTAEISYAVLPEHRGLGLAERACRLLIDWGFEALGLHTIKWLAPKGHWASRKLAWRLGFSIDATLRSWLPHRDTHVDAWAGALLRGEALQPRSEWFAVPTIEDALVRLRRVEAKDLDEMVIGANDPRNQEWIRKLAPPFDSGSAQSYLDGYEEGMANGSAVHWAMADPEDDGFLGVMSVLRITRPQGEIGYWSHPRARGRGVVTRATRLAVKHAFAELGLERLCLYAATPNVASGKVATRAGFIRIGTERHSAPQHSVGMVDCEAFDLLPDDPLPDDPLLGEAVTDQIGNPST